MVHETTCTQQCITITCTRVYHAYSTHLHCFLSHCLLLLWLEHEYSAHVMQPVSQLDEDDEGLLKHLTHTHTDTLVSNREGSSVAALKECKVSFLYVCLAV